MKVNLTPKLKAIIIFTLVAVLATAGTALAVNYVLTLSTPVTTNITPSQPIQIPVSLQAPATATDAEPITLTATITDANGNGKTCNFYDNGVFIGSAQFVNLHAVKDIGAGLSNGNHVWTAGP
jgi:hypothetical protein